MAHMLAGWRALTWQQRRQLVGCVIGIGVMDAGLALFGYGRIRRWTEHWTARARQRQANPDDIAQAQALARLAATAGQRIFGDATCLRRSLLLYGWLRGRGLQPVLHLGLPERRSGPFLAHAWVELSGVPLLRSDAGYRPFAPSSVPPKEA